MIVLIRRVPAVGEAWHSAAAGGGWWLTALVVFEIASFSGYVVVFHRMLGGGRIDRSTSWLITLAGVAATRLLAAGGAGGIALTSWALARSGRPAREVTLGVSSFLAALYAVYLALMVVAATLLGTGVLPGEAARVLIIAGVLIGVAGLALLAPGNERLLERLARRLERRPRMASFAVLLVEAASRSRTALRDWRVVVGALVWWLFDIAALGLSLHRLGAGVTVGVLVLAYCLGLFGNLLPIPGGFGGVEGGLIATLVASGIAVGPAVAGVLAYRFASLWLPTAAGLVAQGVLAARVRRWHAADLSEGAP